MIFETRILRYWKSEYESLEKCEDYAGEDGDHGVFAVSDGVGTRARSETWARCLVERYLDDPFTTTDGFEVERWLLHARKDFESVIGDVELLPKQTRDDLRYAGSAATLAGIRFPPAPTENGDAPAAAAPSDSVECRVVTIGDACVFLCRDRRLHRSHPKQAANEFREAPICFPTIGYDARWWAAVESELFEVRENDVVILATDAVAAWLLVESDSLRDERLRLLLSQTAARWPFFVDTLREAGTIRDDDSTALIIRVTDLSTPLPKVKKFDIARMKNRRIHLEEAVQSKDWLRLALEYGNGEWTGPIKTTGGANLRDCLQLHDGRRMVEARRRTLEALGRYFTFAKSNAEELRRICDEFRDVLKTAPFAQGIRNTLAREGFELRDVDLTAPTSEQSSVTTSMPEGRNETADTGNESATPVADKTATVEAGYVEDPLYSAGEHAETDETITAPVPKQVVWQGPETPIE